MSWKRKTQTKKNGIGIEIITDNGDGNNNVDITPPTTPANILEDFNKYYVKKRLSSEFASIRKDIKENGVVKASEARFLKLQKSLMRTPLLVAKDKIGFLLGIALLVITEYIMLELPSWMPYCYTGLLIPLLVARFFTYHKANYHYFMLDFCYYMQVWAILFYYFFPSDIGVFKVFFGLANGPLLIAIIIWSNRMVLHDFEKITSLYIHIGPGMATFCTRWDKTGPLWNRVNLDDVSITTKDLFYMVIFYVLWQFLYLLKTEFIDSKKLALDKSIMTSARYLSEYRPHPIYKALVKYGVKFAATPTLIVIQLLYTILTCSPMFLIWKYQWAHAALLLITFGVATWNGAAYYFEVFAENYLQGIEDRIMKFHKQEEELGKTKQKTRYAPNSCNSVLVFALYFIFGITILFGTLFLTVWH